MTFSELKRWISKYRPERRAGRRTLPQALHFERLEARTVLSASIGTMPVDIEAGSVSASAPWENIAPVRSWRANEATGVFAEQHWEDRPSYTFDGLLRGDAPPIMPPLALYFNGPTAPSHVYVMIIIRPPVQSLAGQGPAKDQPQKLSASGGTYDETGVNENPRGPLSLQSPNAADAFRATSQPPVARFDWNFTTTVTTNQSPSATFVEAHDTAFARLATDQLLLTAGSDSEDGHGDEDSEDLLGVHNEDGAHADPFGNLLADEGEKISLDALQNERQAIGAVLSELHDIEPTTAPRTDDAASFGSNEGENAVESTVNAPPAEAATGDGGMVWLVPTGDANSSAFDLVNVFATGLPTTARIPAGLDASVGIYQAFDVGAAPTTPAGVSETPSTPSTAPRANASADAEAAKKLEQPT